ncbi:MAG: choice-of-anchor V domain-containing protein [Acidobacteriota bacterium]
MKSARVQTFYLRLAVIASGVAMAALGWGGFFSYETNIDAASAGPSASHTNAPSEDNCTACHTSFPVNSGDGKVMISGLPANYLPNQPISITVTTSDPGPSASIFGFQLTAIDRLGREAGTFTLPVQNPQRTQVVLGSVGGNTRRYVEHTIDGLFTAGVFGSNSWTFTWTAPAQRVGKIDFYAAGNAANGDGTNGGDYIYTTTTASLSGSAIANFDGDTHSDISVFRPSTGQWYSLNSSNGSFVATKFGINGDIIVPGDYDGDGKTDNAVYRPSDSTWYIQQSTAGFTALRFGAPGDIPVQGDYDGDGKTDIAVFRPSTGVWYLSQSTAGFGAVAFGSNGDKPVSADFDGDGKTDLTVFRPSTGVWYSLQSSAGFHAVAFGTSGDVPVPADYDGDGRSDPAVFRPSSGTWYELNSTSGFWGAQFGVSTDIPCPADYDGDGKTDIAVFRPAQGSWFILRSSDSTYMYATFGSNGDIPVPTGYVSQP